MAISNGDGHLVFGNAGHLKRSSSDDHLLRRETLLISVPDALKTGYNTLAPGGRGTAYQRSDIYPALFDNKYDVTWANNTSLYARTKWYTWVTSYIVFYPPYVIYTYYITCSAYSSFALFDTSSINGTSVDSVTINVPAYSAGAGAGACYVGFRTSSSATEDDSYSWITGASEVFAINASGVQTKTFSSALTFGDYLFVTVWVDEYEPPTGNNVDNVFSLSTDFRFAITP